MSEFLKEYCIRCDRRELPAQLHPDKNGDLTLDEIAGGRMSLASLYPHLVDQWHPEKNGPLRPEQVLSGSNRKVWWKCGKGHEWQANIKSRTQGFGCPICAGRVALPGENDLKTMFPWVATQWHPEKNGPLRSEQVLSGSNRKVWWKCSKGHEWQASIKSRTQGAGCPVCAGKNVNPGENDLKSLSPELAEQWNWEKNGMLNPEQVSMFSNRRVWWKCSKGHEWQGKISDRVTKRSGCPYCTNRKVLAGFNDLQTVEPLVAAQWHPDKNAPVEPSMVLPGSTKRVWWRCIDGHEWKAVIYSRTGAQKCGCPVCAGKTPRIYK